ncbi:S-ribosylhomocysteine lyase /quorum-sensing autoinducer 2 (AI-2) synthesis protein LuxS [Caldanaerovirga acetigignens]|uniref:S-ribosylhomocysteine lyase n=1 Tax=Caldanaerovirga acetigignens TaxID=447595 RepID=A0A1M7MG82_9FIRM|nr:S-ribosylhomocysteine lyase [Caldanaerovirga acetigignens]SHM89389.1 S-ribosylhomocysteine lyase /quorum-sensing autoinducer 2 (AI-2) synthesis protein LuxS [Caldanaerovirga acetigignens]
MKVESFELDHTKVKAPYIRLAAVEEGPKGDIVAKYDLRFITPNKGAISSGGMHTLEHLLALFIREELDGIIDISPMGCRTGFYLTKFGITPLSEIKKALESAFEKILKAEEIPAANEVQCGNYKDHSLADAKEAVEKVLNEGLSLLENV